MKLATLFLFAGALAAGDYPWMHTARVFLIDAYEPPFATRLELDAKALAETMAAMNANTVRIATMGKYALIPGVRFTPHPELGSRDILAEVIAASKPRGIRVVPYVSTGHKLAWTMVTRDHPEYAQRTRPGGGPARSHMFVGEDHGTVCWNTPYRQAYLDLVEHLARDYDIDGMYFDTWRAGYFWPRPGVCYCDGCRNGFRAATSMELPWHEREADYTKTELAAIERYHAWNQDNLVAVIQEVRRLVKKYKDIPLIYNINNPVKIASEDPRVLGAMDAFLYERGDSILDRAEGVSVARASNLGVWPYVGEYNNWPRAIYNGLDFTQQIFTTVMFGGAPILALPWGYVNHAENRHYVTHPFAVLKKHEREFAGFTNSPYVGVVYGRSSPSAQAHSRGTWWKTDPRLNSQGAFAACLYGHVQVSSISEQLLDDGATLRPYKVLYLADFAYLSGQRIANLKQFVSEGGGLVTSYGTSLFDAAGVRQRRFALEEMLHAAPIEPEGELAETLANYRSMTGGPYDLYLAEAKAQRLTPLWWTQPVKALNGGEVWQNIVTGDGLRPILPGVIVSSYGKGKVVYCASALESLFLQQNSSAVGETIRALVARAAPTPPPFEMEAPAGLIANLTAKDETMVLHMTNWTGNKLERAGANEYYLAPVENVRVRLNLPAGKKAADVKALVDSPIRTQQKGSCLEIFIPRVEAYQAIRVDLQRR
jgi:hypothetical protein